MTKNTQTIFQPILSSNKEIASRLRNQFRKHNVPVVNIVSSPGSGKTELITVLAQKLISQGKKVSVIVGDLATERDAERIRKSGATAFQIKTNGTCHLDARMIESALTHLPSWEHADIIMIENVGNLVCPASYDLGESLRVVLMSVTEGEDKPLKYPTIFHSSQVCFISKADLSDACGFDRREAEKNILDVAPHLNILSCSAKTGEGLDELIELVLRKQDL